MTDWLRSGRAATRHPAFALIALGVGVALLFGAPLLAQHGAEDDHASPPDTPAVEAHDAPAHDVEAAHDAQADPAEAGHGAPGAHGEDHGEGHGEGGTVHPPTLVSILATVLEGHSVHAPEEAKSTVARFLLRYNAPIFSLLVAILLCTVCILGARHLTLVPGKFQNLIEWVVEGLSNFLGGVLGPDGKRFVPFLGTLFLYIYLQNVFGLIPLMFTPTSVIETTAAMGIVVFCYVQWTAFRANGPVGYLKHLAGDPKDAVGWAMAPLMLPLHIVGELAKPLSLSLRLFGNMMGEETLIAVFLGLGVTILAFTHLPVGLPLHVPFMFLGLLTTLIQALVFTLLSTIYFSLVLPHHSHEEGGHH